MPQLLRGTPGHRLLTVRDVLTLLDRPRGLVEPARQVFGRIGHLADLAHPFGAWDADLFIEPLPVHAPVLE